MKQLIQQIPFWPLLGLAVCFSLASAALITYVCIIFGWDWAYAHWFNIRPILIYMGFPGVFAGMLLPIGLPLWMYWRYRKTRSPWHKNRYRSTLMAFGLSWFISTFLKAVTSRVDIDAFTTISDPDVSGIFRFGFLNGDSWIESVIVGWPSGHTFVAVAMAVAMAPFITHPFWKKANLIYPIFIGLSVSTGFHWISDVLAGAVLGGAVGWAIRQKVTQPHLIHASRE